MDKRRDLLLKDESHDPTKPTRKLADPTVCPECGATYRAGRWTWERGSSEAPRSLCSACQRIQDDYAAGFVNIRGQFARDHLDEIISLVRNIEEREKETHPIKRIMDIVEVEDGLVLRTTEVHLAQAIGKALRGAFKGHLELGYEEDIVRADWVRD
jgi:NMD protein affecting ribosome stability and mRNA decay